MSPDRFGFGNQVGLWDRSRQHESSRIMQTNDAAEALILVGEADSPLVGQSVAEGGCRRGPAAGLAQKRRRFQQRYYPCYGDQSQPASCDHGRLKPSGPSNDLVVPGSLPCRRGPSRVVPGAQVDLGGSHPDKSPVVATAPVMPVIYIRPGNHGLSDILAVH